jgi:hypothetical protein
MRTYVYIQLIQRPVICTLGLIFSGLEIPVIRVLRRSTGGVDLPEVDSLMRCDVCGEALALVRTCHAGRLGLAGDFPLGHWGKLSRKKRG